MRDVMDTRVNLRLVLLGISILVAVASFLATHFDAYFATADGKTSNNFIFGRIFNSLVSNEDGISTSVALKKDLGLQLTKAVGVGEVILSMETSSFFPMVIDGASNVPIELSEASAFSSLSLSCRTILCISFSKLNSDESSPLNLLWKGVGVFPIPDIRWVRNKGLFALSAAGPTGIPEMDRYIASANETVSECVQFAKTHNLQRLYGINEVELKWSYIFLHAFGVELEGRKIFIPPLLFAKHTLGGPGTLQVRLSGEIVEVRSVGKADKGSEILVDGSSYISDVWALLFHGSWLNDDSLHRGLFEIGGEFIWLSNDPTEQSLSRTQMLELFDVSSPAKRLSATKKVIAQLTLRLAETQAAGGSDFAQRIRFVHFHLLLTELVFFEKQLAQLKLNLVANSQ